MGTKKLLPGKGGHFHLNQDSADFFADAFDEIRDYCSVEDFPSLNDALDADMAKDAFENLKGVHGWTYVEDNFGKKVYKALEWQKGELRVTVVLKNDKLNVDVRSWYDPEA